VPGSEEPGPVISRMENQLKNVNKSQEVNNILKFRDLDQLNLLMATAWSSWSSWSTFIFLGTASLFLGLLGPLE